MFNDLYEPHSFMSLIIFDLSFWGMPYTSMCCVRHASGCIFYLETARSQRNKPQDK